MQKKSDTPVLLNKNQIKAIRKMVMMVVKETMGIKSLPSDVKIHGYQVDLVSVVVWAVREMRMHCPNKSKLELNLKLDGRPFWGTVSCSINLPVYLII